MPPTNAPKINEETAINSNDCKNTDTSSVPSIHQNRVHATEQNDATPTPPNKLPVIRPATQPKPSISRTLKELTTSDGIGVGLKYGFSVAIDKVVSQSFISKLPAVWAIVPLVTS